MRTLPVALVVALAAGVHAAPAAAQLRDTTLANGLQIYVIENHAVPLVTEEVMVHNGAMTQDSGQEGVPHLYEHMLFKGYGGGQEQFQRELGELHGSYNGYTSHESVGYFVTVPSKKYSDGLSILARMVRDPDFDDEGLRRERVVVFNEFDRDMAQPDFQLRRAVEQRLWSTAWGHKDPLGQAAAIKAATPAMLKRIYHQYYLPNNAAIFVSGDVSASDVFAAARHAFDGWRAGPDPFIAHPVPAIPALPGLQAVIVTGAVPDVTVMMQWQGPSVGEKSEQTYAADVFASLFNDPSSRVQLNLVASGLFQQISMSYSTLHHVGPILLVGHTTVEALPRAMAALKRELVACSRPNAFDDDAIAGSRQARRVWQALETQSGTTAALRYGDWWGIAGLDYYRTYSDRIMTVTAADVASFAAYYIEQPYVLGLLGPTSQRESLVPPVQMFVADSTPGVTQ